MERLINVKVTVKSMKAVLLKTKTEASDKRKKLEEALQELENDPKLANSIREFVRFHTGSVAKKAH